MVYAAMAAPQNKWELYESKIAELFEYHFGEHFEAFSITSLKSPGTTDTPAEDTQTRPTNPTEEIISATKEDDDPWKNDTGNFSAFKSIPIENVSTVVDFQILK